MVAYDVFLSDCPARTTLSLISGTWTVVVIAGLENGPRRYGELRAHIGGISNKMLTQTLRKLEHNGLIRRRSLSDGGVYELTELGGTLLEPVRALVQWAETNTDELLESQKAHHDL